MSGGYGEGRNAPKDVAGDGRGRSMLVMEAEKMPFRLSGS